jgi:hypothetical protein
MFCAEDYQWPRRTRKAVNMSGNEFDLQGHSAVGRLLLSISLKCCVAVLAWSVSG